MGQLGSRPPFPGPCATNQAWGHTVKPSCLLSKDFKAMWGDKPHTHTQVSSDSKSYGNYKTAS